LVLIGDLVIARRVLVGMDDWSVGRG